MNAPREADVLAACLQLLKLRGALVVRVNSGAVSATSSGKTRFVRFNSAPGCSDVLACLGGRFLAVETKRPGGKLTDLQAAFLDAVRAAGGVAVVVSDVRQLDEALKMEGMVR